MNNTYKEVFKEMNLMGFVDESFFTKGHKDKSAFLKKCEHKLAEPQRLEFVKKINKAHKIAMLRFIDKSGPKFSKENLRVILETPNTII